MSDLTRAYNYDEFIDEKVDPWLRFDHSPALGKPTPDFEVSDLNGTPLKLSTVWRANKYTIVEFGSIT